MKTERILGIDILNTNYDEFMENIKSDILRGNQKVIVAINPEKIMKLREDKVLRDFVEKADYKIPDGVGILMASKKLGGNIKERITGVDTMAAICETAASEGFKVFLLGSREEVVLAAKRKLEKKHENIQIVGVRNGFDLKDEEIIQQINGSEADILFIAMGSPKQELWMDRNKEKLNVKIFQGVGGSFDVLGGFVKRAPIWMQNVGLEWLHRLFMNPSRIFRQMNLLRFYALLKKEENQTEA